MLADRFDRIGRESINGNTFYRLTDVCQAFRIDQSHGTKLVDKSDKRYVLKYRRGYRSIKVCVISRHGVEAIAIRCAGQMGASRSDLMQYFPA